MPTQVFDTPEAIAHHRFYTLRSALRLEIHGLRHSRGSVAPIIRKEIGSKTRNKKALLDELDFFLSGQDRAEG